MKNIYSNIYSFNTKSLKKTIKSLKQGNLAGLPTETVYGLAGNAYSKKAIKKIFKLKKRPKINPLIVHYNSLKDANKDVVLNKNFNKLYKKFCRTFNFYFKKNTKSKIQSMVTANLDTVAIRFPSNKVIKTILKLFRFSIGYA